MTRVNIIFIVFILSCGQSTSDVKTQGKDIKLSTDYDPPAFTESKKRLDSLLLINQDLAQFTFQDLRITLMIGQLFDKGIKHAVLRFKDNDTVANIIVLRQTGQRWDTIFSIKVFPVATSNVEDLIEVTDFNGDNIPDLKVVKYFWDIHPGDNSDLWLYRKGQFTKVEGFDNIVSATYDQKTDLIYSYQSTGCADMSMYFGVFKIVGNKVQKVKEMNCDCCVNSNDSCKIEVVGQKPYLVSYKTAYKYVPKFFAQGVKEKCEMVEDK